VYGIPIGSSLFDSEGAKIVGQLVEKAKVSVFPVEWLCWSDWSVGLRGAKWSGVECEWEGVGVGVGVGVCV
jgi:hypothetical protein